MEDYHRPGIDRPWRTAVRAAYGALAMKEKLRPIPNVYHWVSPCLLEREPAWLKGRTPAIMVGSRENCNSISFYEGTMRPGPVANAR
jgi:hypothetical protein